MNIALFYHSLESDWNHGNAHFLRGVATELVLRGHNVRVFEPADGWSRKNLIEGYGLRPIQAFHTVYPHLSGTDYVGAAPNLDEALADVDLVIVHEWNDPELVRKIGEHSRHSGYSLLFHDTHHRCVSAPEEMQKYDLSHYDGVLAFGKVVRDLYLDNGWTDRAWVWHEAADTRVFRPMEADLTMGDVVWIGNWGDDERTAELNEFLLDPVRRLKVRAAVFGVRYPDEAQDALRNAGIRYHGWLPNYKVPYVFSRFRATVHVPRRPYVEALPGIPTIRPFEAMACGIPLVSAPWDDVEGLFEAGRDYLVAQNGSEMEDRLRMLLADPDAAAKLGARGRATILEKHTCAHRVDELMAICAELGIRQSEAAAA